MYQGNIVMQTRERTLMELFKSNDIKWSWNPLPLILMPKAYSYAWVIYKWYYPFKPNISLYIFVCNCEVKWSNTYTHTHAAYACEDNCQENIFQLTKMNVKLQTLSMTKWKVDVFSSSLFHRQHPGCLFLYHFFQIHHFFHLFRRCIFLSSCDEFDIYTLLC